MLPSDDLLRRHAPVTPVPGCDHISAHQARDAFGLWEAWEAESGQLCDIPFWAVVWPGAAVLARYLLDHPHLAAGRRVVDVGCGGGIAGIAAAWSGACVVTANDIDPVALHVARLNAEANGVSLREEAGDLSDGEQWSDVEVILVADLFYQLQPARRMRDALFRACRRGVSVLIADGGRAFAPRSGVEVLQVRQVPVDRELEGVSHRTVRILTLRAGRAE